MRVRRRALGPALLVAVCVALPSPARAANLTIGDPVPDFTVTTLDGSRVALEEASKSHRAVVILFLSTVCPYANFFGDHIRRLGLEYSGKGILFVAVNSNAFETFEEIAENARDHGYGFAIVKDEGHRLADLLGAKRTPEAFLIDDTGLLRYHGWVKSKIGSTELKDALDALLAGRKVRKPETPAFGCAIDR